MHDLSGVKVERNARVPTLADKGRKREIDVLLTADIAGYTVQIAFECKNERARIGAPKIDAFIGRLTDVGIPLRQGIYVSASGYTTGAVSRAVAEGIRPLVLTGLTKDGLTAAVSQAFQSVVYLLLHVVSLRVANSIPSTLDPGQMLVLYDAEGKFCGSIPDLIWQKWLSGESFSTIGEYEVPLTIPPGWHQVVNGNIRPIVSASARCHVIGLVFTIEGQTRQHLLVNASDKRIEKLHVDALFDTPQEVYPVTVVQSETELDELVKRPASVNVSMGRVSLPRIRIGNVLYWPPSERTVRIVTERMRAFEAGLIPDPRPFDIAELEGTDLQSMWEPIWSQHPRTTIRSNDT